MADHPVVFSITRPERLDRVQLALRILVLAALSLVGTTLGFLMSAAYVALPLVAAVILSQQGRERFMSESAPRIGRALAWMVALYAYFFLLTDKLPLDSSELSTRLEIRPSGAPTVSSALLRLVTSIPSALVLGVLTCVAYFIWMISALMIVLTEGYPTGLYDFQCGVIRWMARLLAYHASLVDTYPQLSFEAGPSEVALSREATTRI